MSATKTHAGEGVEIMTRERSGELVRKSKGSRLEFIVDAFLMLFTKLISLFQRKKEKDDKKANEDVVSSVTRDTTTTKEENPMTEVPEEEEAPQMLPQKQDAPVVTEPDDVIRPTAGSDAVNVQTRRTGARYERELVRLFRDAMPGAEVRRGLHMRNGEDVPDVECPVFWVEADLGQQPSIRNALTTACDTAPPHRMPIAVVRDFREEEDTVTMLLDDFLELIEEWWVSRRMPPPRSRRVSGKEIVVVAPQQQPHIDAPAP